MIALENLQKPSSPTTSLEVTAMKDEVNVKMPQNFYDKVEYLCKKINTVEWSGILLYSFEGTLEQPKNLVITLQDIILMDKGSGTYTEYQYNQNGRDPYIDYRERYPERKEWRIGHIHSHNNMGVFFSGTDNDELKENSSAHVFYLSLIVNNNMEACAKIAYQAYLPEEKLKRNLVAKNEKDQLFTVKTLSINLNKRILCVHNCKIDFPPKRQVELDSFFLENVEEVLNSSKKSSTRTIDLRRSYTYPPMYEEEDVPFTNLSYQQPSIKYRGDEEISNNVSKLFDSPQGKTSIDFLNKFFEPCLPPLFSKENLTLARTIQGLHESDMTMDALEKYIEANFIKSMCDFFNYTFVFDRHVAIPHRIKDCVKNLKVSRSSYPFLRRVINIIEKSLKKAQNERTL